MLIIIIALQYTYISIRLSSSIYNYKRSVVKADWLYMEQAADTEPWGWTAYFDNIKRDLT